MSQSQILNTVEALPRCAKEGAHPGSAPDCLEAQRLRVFALALLNLELIDQPVRHYQRHYFSITQSAAGVLTVCNQGQLVMCSDREGQLRQVTPRLIAETLKTIQTVYLQVETFQWLLETGEDPPSDWELHCQVQRVQAEDIAAIAQRMFLNNNDSITLDPYQIAQTDLGLVITRGSDDLVLIVRENYVWNYSTTTQDWEFFQHLKLTIPDQT